MKEAVKLNNIVTQNLLSGRCDNCGSGYRHKDQTGLRKWCKRCIGVYERKAQRSTDAAERLIIKAVGSKYGLASFDGFTGQDKDLRDELLKLRQDQDVFMYGSVGSGKTYAMAALLRHFVYEGYDCQRINFDDFCVQVRATMSKAATQTEWEMIKPLKEIDKLFIDDLGLRSKQETDFAYVTLYSIINKRQENGLPTYICSNKNIEQLGRSFDERIASRLKRKETKIIHLDGEDRRQKGGSK